MKFNNELKIIELTYSGLVSPIELKDAFVSALALSKTEQASRVLTDCTHLTGGHSVIDLFSLISLFQLNDLRGMKEAIILPSLEASIKDIEFYETACLNRGFNVKIFANIQDAITWLRQ